MPYEIRIGPDAREELRHLPVRMLGQVTAAMKRELTHLPRLDRKPRKQLQPDPEAGITPTRPVWQLRIGDYRVFYDVDEEDRTVMIQRVLFKGRKRTQEILR